MKVRWHFTGILPTDFYVGIRIKKRNDVVDPE